MTPPGTHHTSRFGELGVECELLADPHWGHVATLREARYRGRTHGEPDSDVPFEESVQVLRNLGELGVECELLADPDWGHAFIYMTDEPTVRSAWSKMLEFASRHVRVASTSS